MPTFTVTLSREIWGDDRDPVYTVALRASGLSSERAGVLVSEWAPFMVSVHNADGWLISVALETTLETTT